MSNYTTIQGDTWDVIAKKVYDDEAYTFLLMEANPKLLDYFVFPEGIVVTVPEKPKETGYLPEWRT